MLKAKRKPYDEELEDDDEPVDLAVLMGGASAPPVGADEEDDEYTDDELAESEVDEGGAPMGEAVSPELLSFFETFDDQEAPIEERAAALQSFFHACSRQKY